MFVFFKATTHSSHHNHSCRYTLSERNNNNHKLDIKIIRSSSELAFGLVSQTAVMCSWDALEMTVFSSSVVTQLTYNIYNMTEERIVEMDTQNYVISEL